MNTVTLTQIADALGVSRQAVDKRARRDGWRHESSGRTRLYTLNGLPADVQAALIKAGASSDLPAEPPGSEPAFTYDAEQLWDWAARRSQKLRDRGAERAALLRQVMRLVDAGQTFDDAAQLVAQANEVSAANLRNWYYGVNGQRGARLYDANDWPAALIPAYTGRTAKAGISMEAWDAFKALYLARRAPTLAICYERVERLAKEQGWTWPSRRTIERKVKQDIPRAVLVLAREGAEALEKLYPPMQRNRTHFHALQAVNGDGVEFHFYIKWPDGEVSRAKIWIWQDLYSNKLLAWRHDKTENKNMLRLAWGDLISKHGIPPLVYIDNTTAAASKWLTGGTKNRYRWKIRDEDPLGIIPSMGSDVRFVRPGHGQSKPIERANKELRERIDSHPQFDGRGTKGRPIPLDEFLQVMEAEFAWYNAKEGRDTLAAAGRSFDATYKASYERATIKKATAEQRRRCLLAAERVHAHRETGAIELGRGPHGANRYWMESLTAYHGEYLVARFDPHAMHDPVHVYTLDGRYIGEAPCTFQAGFDDADAAQTYHRETARFKRHTKRALEAEKRAKTAAVAKRLPEPTTPDTPDAKVVELARPQRKRAAGHDVVADEELDENNRNFDRLMTEVWSEKKSRLL